MNIKTFSILAIITAILVVLAVNMTEKPAGDQATENSVYKQPVFAGLADKLDQVAKIHLKHKEGEVTLARGEDKRWGVTEKSGYPADVEKISKLLLGASDLRYLEAKTGNPELFAKLNLQDVSAEDSAAVQVTLQDSADNTLAEVLVGKQKTARMDNTRKEIYIRKPGEEKTWLTLGNLPVEYDKKPEDWLVREVMSVEQKRIREVSVNRADGSTLRVYKDSAEANDYQLADIPADAKVKSQYTVNGIAGSLAGLRLDDVMPESEVDWEQEPASAVFSAFDGLQINLTTVKKDAKHYARLNAAYVAPPVEEPAAEVPAEGEEAAPPAADSAKSAEEIQAEVAKLNETLKGWAFVLPTYKMSNLLKPKEELFSLPGEEDNSAGMPGGSIADALNNAAISRTTEHGLELTAPKVEVEDEVATESTATP